MVARQLGLGDLRCSGDDRQGASLLQRMSMLQLMERWRSLVGTDPGRMGRGYLVRRLAYRIQELTYGGLSRDARKQLATLADGLDGDAKNTSQKA